MLATQSTDLQDLHTIDAGGFSATVDAFARDETTDGLWFLSMVGSQTALKAIWASLLKQPPDVAHLITGRRRHASLWRLPAVLGALRHHRHLDGEDRPAARVRGLACPRVYQNGGVRLRAGLFSPPGHVGGESPGPPSALPGPAQFSAPPQLLGGLALATRPGLRGDFPPSVRRSLGLPVLPRCRKAQG